MASSASIQTQLGMQILHQRRNLKSPWIVQTAGMQCHSDAIGGLPLVAPVGKLRPGGSFRGSNTSAGHQT